MVWFHSKLPYDDKNHLGIGVSVSRLPRTS